MTLKDYLNSFIPGFIMFGVMLYTLWDKPLTTLIQILYLLAVFCLLMFPFAKQCIERIALRYTRPEDWTTGVWVETPAKNGIYAMYYMLLFAIAIPLGAGYLIYLAINRKTSKHRSGRT
jgi:hypothetical protein